MRVIKPEDEEKRVVQVFEKITTEYLRACELFPSHPSNKMEAYTIFMEEAGELAKAILDHKYKGAPYQDIETEAVQAAAMLVRFLLIL